MPLHRVNHRLACCLLAAVGAGCASDSVVFVTKTSLGVDVSAQPPAAHIGYDRFEGYIGPRFDNGAVPPVAANFETNGQLLDRAVRQVYATGQAARVVTGAAGTAASAPQLAGGHKVMSFSTGTTVGLKLGFGSAAADSLTFGYKRREVSVIPLTNGSFPSVLATLENEYKAADRAQSEFGVQQYFATGEAAESLAARKEVKSLFARRFADLDQARGALAATNCVLALPDADLARAWAHAERQKLIGVAGTPTAAQLAASGPAAGRAHYASTLAVPDPTSPDRTGRLTSHMQFVCALAGR